MEEESFVTHLDALRKALLGALIFPALMLVPGWLLSTKVMDFLIGWCLRAPGGEEMQLHFFSPMEAFTVRLKVTLVLALVLGFPGVLSRVWGFILPALYDRERRAARFYLFFATILFFSGAAFAVVGIMPFVIRFAMNFATQKMTPLLGLSSFFELAGELALAFGLMFQMPIAVMLLTRFGVVRKEVLADKRPYVVVILLVIAAILTPPDIVSQIMLFLPAWLLFELGLLLSPGSKNEPSEE
ncbi:MAG: twin-arginine translocase subunit TatC [Victivallaceae bacterium]|nr:twin-arginine translocase subunit TatC [Victivallaceae bacterium]